MKNLVKDIEQNCEDKSVQGIVDFLVERGDISYISNYHREIWFFYKELRDLDINHRKARKTTMDMFQIGAELFKRVIRKYRPSHQLCYSPIGANKIEP